MKARAALALAGIAASQLRPMQRLSIAAAEAEGRCETCIYMF